jgi:hypothetical protein
MTVMSQKLIKEGRYVFDYDLVARIISHICRGDKEGAVLIFMPGFAEIKKFVSACATLCHF